MILKLLEAREVVFDTKFTKVVFCLPSESINLHGELIENLKKLCPDGLLQVHEGLPTDLQGMGLTHSKAPKLIICDDLLGAESDRVIKRWVRL